MLTKIKYVFIRRRTDMGESGKGAKFPRKPSRRSSQRTVVSRRTGSATAKTEQPADEHRRAHNRQHTAKLNGVRHMQGHEEVSVRERNAYVQIRGYRQAADHTVHQLSRHAQVRSMQRLGIRAAQHRGRNVGRHLRRFRQRLFRHLRQQYVRLQRMQTVRRNGQED